MPHSPETYLTVAMAQVTALEQAVDSSIALLSSFASVGDRPSCFAIRMPDDVPMNDVAALERSYRKAGWLAADWVVERREQRFRLRCVPPDQQPMDALVHYLQLMVAAEKMGLVVSPASGDGSCIRVTVSLRVREDELSLLETRLRDVIRRAIGIGLANLQMEIVDEVTVVYAMQLD